MAENTRNVDSTVLERFIRELFTAGGMKPEEAAWYAHTIVQANLWGIDSHGAIRVPTYFRRILIDAINRNADIRVIRKAPAVTLIDADGAAGAVAAKVAMEQAVEDAKTYGIAMAGVTNSNHFGASAVFSKLAADAGMIGIAMTNVMPLIAAPGSKGAVVGTNPISVAIPTYNDFPFTLDMSISVVAGGKLHLAVAKGEPIPLGWGIDKDGNDTTDPKAALEGYLLPIGGYKGLGLGYVVDILSGLLTGGLFADKMRSMYHDPDVPSLTGHMFMAINAKFWMSEDELKDRMTYYHDFIQSIPVKDGSAKLIFPGELEANVQKQRLLTGIPVPLSTLDELNRLGETYHIPIRL